MLISDASALPAGRAASYDIAVWVRTEVAELGLAAEQRVYDASLDRGSLP